jgi:hypothetical protein
MSVRKNVSELENGNGRRKAALCGLCWSFLVALSRKLPGPSALLRTVLRGKDSAGRAKGGLLIVQGSGRTDREVCSVGGSGLR